MNNKIDYFLRDICSNQIWGMFLENSPHALNRKGAKVEVLICRTFELYSSIS